ncbi:hypothetical protein JAAARDRAFT_462613 [Jaapia argillacea MUCL 33604]|uniref:DUF6533 domain-containing protein n=1 Tax=Jaapia argillacea MUCL 33604 TaxID=933084 RepID=A0A067Q636_9AGAM|nr:hypothetical protein JAAARDRAFT_462613 [Jaapia argillacea MUCL 33604]
MCDTACLSHYAEIGAWTTLVGRYGITAVYAVQVYEWLIAFDEEWEHIHQRRWTSVKMAYLFCRYWPLCVFPFHMWAWLGDHEQQTCAGIVRVLYALLIPCPLAAQAVMLLRAVAFTGRNSVVLGILGFGYSILTVLQIWIFGTHFVLVEEVFQEFGRSGCFANDKIAQEHIFIKQVALPTAGLFLAVFLFDVLSIGSIVVHYLRRRSLQIDLGKLFIEQGIAAFVVISVINILSAASYMDSTRVYMGMTLPAAFIIPDIIACRLILTLRRRASRTEFDELQLQSLVVREAVAALEMDDRSGKGVDGQSQA